MRNCESKLCVKCAIDIRERKKGNKYLQETENGAKKRETCVNDKNRKVMRLECDEKCKLRKQLRNKYEIGKERRIDVNK